MSAALDYVYQYPFPSAVTLDAPAPSLSLATCSRTREHPYFFDGTMRDPRVVGDMMLVLSDVVRTHFFLPRPALLDPVLTSSESMLRLEGFSGCCGVYARVDLPAESFDGELRGRGTTNVDFNNPMRTALTRIKNTETVRLAVGRDEVALVRDAEKTVEKKVKLPLRWVKGFSEVQAYQPGLTLMHEVSGAEALRFVRALPRGASPKRPSFVVRSGKTLRLSQREKSGAMRLSGTSRIRVLEPLLTNAKALRLWGNETTGTSGWQVVFERGGFFLMVSPELYRGFSGEGQILETLASGRGASLLSRVRAELRWQNQIDAGAIASRFGVAPGDVRAALALLGSRGLAGYDVSAGCYFHRELPFDVSKVESLQPRLKDARALLDGGHVEIAERLDDDRVDVRVAGTNVKHYVRIRPDQDRCTCPWFSRHQGERGPCKHILAAQMFKEAQETGTVSEDVRSERTGS